MLLERKDELALQALWALYVSGGFDDALAENLLGHADPDVRSWTIRLLGDSRKISPAIREHLRLVAHNDPSCTVRNQLACTCKRLPGKDSLPIVQQLLQRTEDFNDPQIPLLLWWAIEDKATSDRDAVLQILASPETWHNPLIRRFIIERLSRRYMAAGGDADLCSCARLLELAPGRAESELVLAGMEKALEGRRLKSIPPALSEQLAKQPASPLLVRIGVRLNDASAYHTALGVVGDPHTPAIDRMHLIYVLGQLGKADCVPGLLRLVEVTEPSDIRLAALTALQSFSDPQIGEAILRVYATLSGEMRSRAQSLLGSRPQSTLAFLKFVDSGRINPKGVPFDQVRRFLLHRDAEIHRLVEKHWGKIGQEPPGEKRARIASVQHMLGTGRGEPVHGKPLFEKKCAICHALFGEGAKIGPDLTGSDRRDTRFLVTSIVDPSAVIRNEYVAYVVSTSNGRILTGLMSESTPKTITLVDSKTERTTIPREDIEEIKPSPQSLMPEKILDDLDEQQIRDLLSYVQGNGPVAAKNQAPLQVCLVSGSLEYKSDESLAAFQNYLESHYNVRCSRAFRKADDDLPGLENLAHCDVMLLFTRRLTISGEQLERIKRYCRSGKPIVAVRTASHAFQNWLALDKVILGGNYGNHYGSGSATDVRFAETISAQPILAGVNPFRSPGSLYRNTGLAPDVHVLLTGSIPGHTEPVAWTRMYNGGRVFYTSLGHPKDFKNESFVRMLVNALYWTTKREPPPDVTTSKIKR
jgi:putative heme-binding domain-containing protein